MGRRPASKILKAKSKAVSLAGNHFQAHDLIWRHFNCTERQMPTTGPSTDSTDPIDGKTSRSICNAVGERLQQSIRPDPERLPERLRHLMDALRQQDAKTRQS
jgi:hypothetical protein